MQCRGISEVKYLLLIQLGGWEKVESDSEEVNNPDGFERSQLFDVCCVFVSEFHCCGASAVASLIHH